VVIDSGLKGHDYVSFVATDNRKGGRLAGEHLASLLKPGGKVVMLRYAEGSESTLQREAGFLEAIGAAQGVEVLSANQYGGADVEGAYKRSESLLSRFKKADGSLAVDGIFTPNESTTLAMLRVLEDNGWAGKVRFVGFDASDTLAKGLADSHLDGLVLQDPVNMGYLGVKTIVAHIHGQPIEARVDTGVRLVTHDRMNDADAKELLHPDLSRWLKP
jgi:ribose transport system substrate-binding protein